LFILVLIVGAFSLFYVEVNHNPNITSIDDAFWFVIVTISTVGYGDISPQTEMGRIIGTIIIFTGIGFMSLLTASLATFFVNRHRKKEEIKVEDKLEHIEEQMNKKFDDMQSEITSLKELIKKK
jgi:voltage-gated potassium channel